MPPADRQQTGVLYLMQPAIILPPPANSGGAPLPTLRESGGCPRGSVRASCASAALVPFSSPAPRCALRLCSALSKRGGAGGCFLRITQTHTHCYTLHTHKVAQPIVCVCLCVKLKQQGESDVSPCFAHRARPDCAAGGEQWPPYGPFRLGASTHPSPGERHFHQHHIRLQLWNTIIIRSPPRHVQDSRVHEAYTLRGLLSVGDDDVTML